MKNSGGVELSLLSDPVHESHSDPAAAVSAAGPPTLPVAESADAPVLVSPPGNESSHPISLLSFVCICRRWPTVRGIPVPQAVTYCPGVGRSCYCDDHELFLCGIILNGLLVMFMFVMCRVDIEGGGRGVEEGNRILNEEVGGR